MSMSSMTVNVANGDMKPQMEQMSCSRDASQGIQQMSTGLSRERIFAPPGAGILIDKITFGSGEAIIQKYGARVRQAEARALEIVQERNYQLDRLEILAPEILKYKYDEEQGWGIIDMEFVPGKELEEVWGGLEDECKTRICQDTWHFVQSLQQISPEPAGHFACCADGSPSTDPLLADITEKHPRPITDATDLQSRISERYKHFGGPDKQLRDKLVSLPASSTAVFTHGDIAPRNIMVEKNEQGKYQITSFIDWEAAGWYPAYWEYVCMMRNAVNGSDWRDYMTKTAPEKLVCDTQAVDEAYRWLIRF